MHPVKVKPLQSAYNVCTVYPALSCGSQHACMLIKVHVTFCIGPLYTVNMYMQGLLPLTDLSVCLVAAPRVFEKMRRCDYSTGRRWTTAFLLR